MSRAWAPRTGPRPRPANGSSEQPGFQPLSSEVASASVEAPKALAPGPISIDPLQMLDRVKDGRVNLSVPLTPGKYSVKGVRFTVEPGTVAQLQVEVKDGKLVPRGRDGQGGSKVDIRPPIDLPLWVTGQGAYLRQTGEARAAFAADLGGLFDLKFKEAPSLALGDVVRSLTPEPGPSAPSAPAPASNSSPKPGLLPKNLIGLGGVKYSAEVSMKEGPVDLGGAKLALAPGTQVQVAGDANSAKLSGQVALDSLAIGQRGLAMKVGRGTAQLEASFARETDGTVSVHTKMSGISAHVEQLTATSKDPARREDHVTLGPTAIKDGTIELASRLRASLGARPEVLSSSAQAHFEADGSLTGAHLTIQDARDTAAVDLGLGRFKGEIDFGEEGIRLDARFEQIEAKVADLQTANEGSALSIKKVALSGPASVQVDSAQGKFDLQADARQVELTVDDYRGRGGAVDVDLGEMHVTGAAKVKVGSGSGLTIDGKLAVETSIDSLEIRDTAGKKTATLGENSKLSGTVTRLAAGGGQDFALKIEGARVDASVSSVALEVPGAKAAGAGRLSGKTDFDLGSQGLFFTNTDATVSMRVEDAKVAPGAMGASFDFAAGSRLDLNVRELRFPSQAGVPLVKLGPGSKLEAELDGGRVEIAGQKIELEKGSRARLEIDSLQTGKGMPALTGRLSLEARLDVRKTDLGALVEGSGVTVTPTAGAARAKIVADQVTLTPDGVVTVKKARFSIDAKVGKVVGATDRLGTPHGTQALRETPSAGILGKSEVETQSAAAIAGNAHPLPAAFNPLDVARRVKDGTVEVEVPLEGALSVGGVKLATVKPGATLKMALQVKDGKIDPARTRVNLGGLSGALGVIRGAYLDQEGTLRLDLAGMPDFAVPGMSKLPMNIDGFLKRLDGGAAAARAKEAGGQKPSAHGIAGQALEILQLDRARLSVKEATFSAGPVSLPGGVLKLDEGTRLSLAGTLQAARLSGKVKVGAVDFAGDGVALATGKGTADLEMSWRTEGRASKVTAELRNVSVDTRYAVQKRANGDYIHLAEGRVEGGTVTMSSTVGLDAQGLPTGEFRDTQIGVKMPRFSGEVAGARVTVPDANGTATVEIAHSRVEGEVAIDRGQISLKAQVNSLDLAVRDLTAKQAGNNVEVGYAHVQGSGKVAFTSDHGFSVDGQQVSYALRAQGSSNLGGKGKVSAESTRIQGRGRFSYQSTGQLSLEGDLHLEGAASGTVGKAKPPPRKARRVTVSRRGP